VAATGATVAVTLAAVSPEDRALAVAVRGLMVAVPAAVGLYALHRGQADRFARLLIATALLLSVTTLAQSSDALLHGIGRVSVWVVEALIVYLLLGFPFGRLTARVDRILFGAIVAVDGLLYLPTALAIAHFPEPSPWDRCGERCPRNPFAVTSEPAFVDSLVRPAREVLTVLVFLAVAVVLADRLRRARPLERRTLVPVVGAAGIRVVAIAAYFIARDNGPLSLAAEALG
jgi:hypothetical protein